MMPQHPAFLTKKELVAYLAFHLWCARSTDQDSPEDPFERDKRLRSAAQRVAQCLDNHTCKGAPGAFRAMVIALREEPRTVQQWKAWLRKLFVDYTFMPLTLSESQ